MLYDIQQSDARKRCLLNNMSLTRTDHKLSTSFPSTSNNLHSMASKILIRTNGFRHVMVILPYFCPGVWCFNEETREFFLNQYKWMTCEGRIRLGQYEDRRLFNIFMLFTHVLGMQ